MASKLGLKDTPIDHLDDESLGLGQYARVLSDFVDGCDTPITIALQGDWGSGKTSLMNLIKQVLEQPGKRYETVWFNTWQYAQFNMSDSLALYMMRHFVDALSRKEGLGKVAEKALNAIGSIGKAVAVGGAGMVGQGDSMRGAVEQLGGAKTGELDPARALQELKDSLTEVVAKRVAKPDTDKVVVFIDDLDRLVPTKAVELLEALKLFLDIDHCVYIIACDYKVVARGLKEKFGEEGDRKGKSFFDKIIQVPFKMPTRQYETDTYIAALLDKIGVPAEGSDVEMYRGLVDSSVGFNPRTMKRLFNSLLLLNILLDRLEGGNATKDQRRDRCRVLFGILCLQEVYEPLYDVVREGPLTDEVFANLQNNLGTDTEFEDLRAKLKKDVGTEVDFDEVSTFVEKFYDCIQLEDEGSREELSKAEQDHLEQMLQLTAVVSANEGQAAEPREYAKDLRKELNERYRKHIGKGRPKIEKFRFTRGEESKVFLHLPAGIQACLVVWCSANRLRFGLEPAVRARGGRREELPALARHLYDESDQQPREFVMEGEKCIFFEATLDDATEDAKANFSRQIHELLEPVMPRLFAVCSAYRG